MTIRKGEPWGAPGALPAGCPVFGDDRSARAAIQTAHDSGVPLRTFGLVGGDLHRTLGSPAHDVDALVAGEGTCFPLDLGLARLDDGPEVVFFSHLVARARRGAPLWSSHTVTVMNGSFYGELDLGPRAHPNDGRLDVVWGRVPLGQRREAARRSLSGRHVPHPALLERRVERMAIDTGPSGVHVEADGEPVGHAARLEVRVLPDALTVVV